MSTNVASVTKHFPSAQNGFTTTLGSTISSGAITVPLNSVAGYTNGQVAVMIVDPTSATAKQTFTGVVDTSGVQLTSVVWTAGTNQTHLIGATVVDYESATHFSMIAKGLLVGHNQDGTHQSALPLTSPKITTAITDANGNEVIKTPATTSATNEITVTNAINGAAPKISATGSSDTNVALNLQGKGTGSVQINGTDILAPLFDHVVSGIVITADNAGSNKNYSITSGVVCISGNYLTVSAVSAQTVGASKDRYIDLTDNGDGTAVYVTNEVTNNAASQALTAGNMRVGIVAAGSTTIADAAHINQGQEDRVIPIASSIPYAVTDSIGNLICPRDPNRKIIGYRQIIADFNTASNNVDITGLNLNCIVPTGRKVKVTGFIGNPSSSAANNAVVLTLIDVTASSTALTLGSGVINASGDSGVANPIRVYTPASTTMNYKAQISHGANSATSHTNSSSTDPSYLLVELE